MSKKHIRAAALFSGIGGLCLGFERVGIKTSWAIENDPYATQTYRNNIKDVRLLEEDIRKVSVEKHSLEPVDVLHAGFPCQSFSQAGVKRGFDDPRGKLFYELIRIIEEFGASKPPVIVLENSPYLRSGDEGRWFLELMKNIKKAGYWFRESNCAELNTYDLTPLPQKRNRLFMVAFSTKHFKNGKFDFPTNNGSFTKTMADHVKFGEHLEDDSYYLPKENRYYKMISKHVNGKECLYQLRKYLVRVQKPDVCPTLTANMGLGGHNVPFINDKKGIRKLTEYECLSLQGFPEWFSFPKDVPRAKRYVQAGNSVSVPVAELLARFVKEKIDRECKNV